MGACWAQIRGGYTHGAEHEEGAAFAPVPAPDGWRAEDLPIASSPGELQRAYEALDYHEVWYREYRRETGAVQVRIYAAHWPVGKISYKKIGRHTPDGCWRAAGWWMESQRSDYGLQVGHSVSKPGQWRIFGHPREPKLHVVFWHLVGGTPVVYDGPGPVIDGQGILDGWFEQKQEQYFIRISSTIPFDQLETIPGWNEIIGGFRSIGLFRGAAFGQ